MLTQKMVVVGGGNMGSAIVRGVLGANLMPPERITVVDVVPAKLEELSDRWKVRTAREARDVAGSGDLLLLCVKPQILMEVLDGIRDVVRPEQLIVSIVAGAEAASIRDRIGKNNPVIRAMPNIAATVGAAASAVSACPPATDEHLGIAQAIFGAVGEVVRVEEEQLDAVTGLSGSGPAYIYMIIEALCDGGVKMGLPRDTALRLATQTVLGAARLVKETDLHPAILRDRVTTPGGTTIAAIHQLEEKGLRTTLMRAVEAATERSRELARIARR